MEDVTMNEAGGGKLEKEDARAGTLPKDASGQALVPHGSIQRATALVSQISMLSSLIGPVLGGLVFGAFGIEPVVAASAALLLMAAATALPLPAMAAYALVVCGLFLTMACCTLFSVLAVAFVQGETPAHLIGKVMALVVGLSNCASPIGQLLYGGVLDAFRGAVPVVVAVVVAISLALAAAVARVLERGLGVGAAQEALRS